MFVWSSGRLIVEGEIVGLSRVSGLNLMQESGEVSHKVEGG